MSVFKTLALIIGLAVLLLILAIWRDPFIVDRIIPTPAIEVQPSGRPEYVQLCSLTETRDDAHPVEVVAEDGTVWYRDNSPILTLDCIDGSKIHVDEFLGGHAVILRTRLECYNAFNVWSRQRIGQMAGILVDGRLVFVARMVQELGDQVAISDLDSLDEAESLIEDILTIGYGVKP